MIYRFWLFCTAFMLCTVSFAANVHLHPSVTGDASSTQNTAKKIGWGYCEVEIVNESYDDIHITGVFDDGSPLYPFNLYSFEFPHTISLYYYGYCHAGLRLYVESFNGYPLFDGFVRAGGRLVFRSYFGKAKATLSTK